MTNAPGDWLTADETAEVLRDDPAVVAPRLLGARLTGRDGVGLRIVEVEAYAGPGADAASHAFRGRTPRNAPMFGPVGHLYVYRSYGIHLCLNVVAHAHGGVGAVLLRAAEVADGAAAARRDRHHLRPGQLAQGPGRLGAASGFGLDDSGLDLLGHGLLVVPATPAPDISTGPRIGISAGTDRQWRFWLPGSACVSRPR